MKKRVAFLKNNFKRLLQKNPGTYTENKQKALL